MAARDRPPRSGWRRSAASVRRVGSYGESSDSTGAWGETELVRRFARVGRGEFLVLDLLAGDRAHLGDVEVLDLRG